MSAVVCGGSRGLGRQIALALARRGYDVAVCSRTQEDVDRVRDEIAEVGVGAYGERCDLRSEIDTRDLLDRVEAQLGPIDLLVTNAATIAVGPIAVRTARDFDEAIGTTFKSALHPILSVLPRMRARRRGTIAVVASIGGKLGVPHLAPYSTAKFATVGFAEALAAEEKQNGIHVLTVIPGLMRTGSHLGATFDGDAEKEYEWFAAGATMPLVSIDVERAAKKIVDAIARKKTRLVFTLPARLALPVHDNFPALFGAVSAFVARFILPKSSAKDRQVEGRDVEARSHSAIIDLIAKRSDVLAPRNAQPR